MDMIWEQIRTITEKVDGYIRTSQVEEAWLSIKTCKVLYSAKKLQY